MITITTNMGDVLELIKVKLNNINGQRICMAMANHAIGDMRKRIHVEGKDSNNSQIGTYSDGYMKVRTDNFKSDVYTRGKKKSEKRILYNRNEGTKVIASLTREMENTMKVFPLENGAGIGWDDKHNFDKSEWVEETYGKNIYQLTSDELSNVKRVAYEEVEKALAS